MQQNKKYEIFEKLVVHKFAIYNSLFLNLPYNLDDNIGIIIPVLNKISKKGLDNDLNPKQILDDFFNVYTTVTSEKERIDFMFKVIQFVERQVVLFDSVEDAAFKDMEPYGNDLDLKSFFQISKNAGKQTKVIEKLNDFSARIVLTAHPTQFYPPSVLDIIAKLRDYITNNDINSINETLKQLGLTSFLNTKKPTPFDEAKNIIYFLRNVFYNAVGDVYTHIKNQVKTTHFDNTDIIKLGFWPGGDRDGNPFVTSSTTMKVADELRINLLKCYYFDIKDLQQKMSFKKIDAILIDLRLKVYDSFFDKNYKINYLDILQPLLDIRQLLIGKFYSMYLNDLDQLIDKVKIFKTHFATLDIRQDHSMHLKTMTAILIKENCIKKDISELSDDALLAILLNKNFKINASDYQEPIIKDTIKNIKQLAKIQAKNGESGCNRYIISNSEDKFAVLFVFAFFKWCGWDETKIKFDIIPLFETMLGMDTSNDTMQQLFTIPQYKQHVAQRDNKQTIMLGFSDGTKDGGYLKANWSISKTKESLSEVCTKNNVKVLFFDGRGGPPARGGGKTHRFYATQSKKIANNEIQLTIQGQTITSIYGSKDQFIHNFEQLLTAGLSLNILDNKNDFSDKNIKLIEELAQLSFTKYDALKKHKTFIPYLENKSTLKYYGKANIGSRPGKRGTDKKLKLTDLRAISFVGSWSQLKQNVPGYYGIGTAIKALVDQGKSNELKALYNEVPFFKALLQNSMMSLSKTNFKLTTYIQDDPQYKEFWQILHKEYQLSIDMLLLISNSKSLMEESPITLNSIKIREQIVLPLLIIQQYALQKMTSSTDYKALYEKIIIRSLYGNINASRNSV
ncbi:MAG: phosphoenolpyruvate carboxylase [Flavobacteriaceae bacterium]